MDSGVAGLCSKPGLVTLSQPMTISTSTRLVQQKRFQQGPKEAQRTLDREIALLEERTRQLRTQRNGLASVSKLPPEVLCEIFRWCTYQSQDYHYDYCPMLRGSSPGTYGYTTPLVVAHVSRHWRSTAFGCPSLWSRIRFVSPSLAREMLRLSRMAILDVEADMSYMAPRTLEIVNKTLDQLSRISKLELILTKTHFENGVADMLKKPAPHLERLTLTSHQRSHLSLPSDIFDGDAPMLRHLKLDRCELSLTSPILSASLETLCLHSQSPYNGVMTELLDVLERATNLRVLELDGCIPQLSPDTASCSPTSRVVSLPRLAQLVLRHSSTIEAASLLNHLQIPPSVEFCLLCHGTTTSKSDYSALHPTLRHIFKGSGCTAPTVLGVSDISRGVIVRAWERWEKWAPIDHLVDRGWRIHLDLTYFTAFPASIQATFSAIPMTNIQILSIQEGAPIGSDVWIGCFGMLPLLRKIYIHSHGTDCCGLVQAIGQLRKTSSSRTKKFNPSALYYSALEDVEFREVRFDFDFEELTEVLMKRCNYGCPIRSLAFRECDGLDETSIDSLKEIVVDVDWDGHISQFSESEYEDEFSYYAPYPPFFDIYSSDDDMVLW